MAKDSTQTLVTLGILGAAAYFAYKGYGLKRTADRIFRMNRSWRVKRRTRRLRMLKRRLRLRRVLRRRRSLCGVGLRSLQS